MPALIAPPTLLAIQGSTVPNRTVVALAPGCGGKSCPCEWSRILRRPRLAKRTVVCRSKWSIHHDDMPPFTCASSNCSYRARSRSTASEWFHHWKHQYWFCDRSTDSSIVVTVGFSALCSTLVGLGRERTPAVPAVLALMRSTVFPMRTLMVLSWNQRTVRTMAPPPVEVFTDQPGAFEHDHALPAGLEVRADDDAQRLKV